MSDLQKYLIYACKQENMWKKGQKMIFLLNGRQKNGRYIKPSHRLSKNPC